MEKIQFKKEYVKLKNAPAHKTERGELLDTILKRINKEREGTIWKPLSPIALSIKLKGFPTKDLYGFIKECNEAEATSQGKCSFGMCFFGRLKKK